MSNCAFWLHNCILLLYYLRKDPDLFETTSEVQIHLSDLINEAFVFVVRDAERRIDRILDQAMLNHEAVPGFEDVRFEDQWRIVSAVTSRMKRESRKPSVMSIFSSSMPPASPDSTNKSESGSPLAVRRGKSLVNLRGSPSPSPARGGAAVTTAVSPRTIAGLLSSTLFVLQSYEIHPCVIVQAFSQIFYWLGCELTNRILLRVRAVPYIFVTRTPHADIRIYI
jgi:hypothetical protein